METLRALVRGDLSPAGNKISLVSQPENFGYQIDGYDVAWVDSGTSALALALIDIKKKAQKVANPKVIIPGYCCPDLVAAAVYAGVKPVVVDICADDASYDFDLLGNAIQDANVVAIIAVNFLGIKERLEELKNLIQHRAIKIIEDNAQWFPVANEQHKFVGDYILFSFGRGKPLSLLGGGALFSKDPLAVKDAVLQGAGDSATLRVKAHLYNMLLKPHLYCYLNHAPFFNLGETRYHQHEKIMSMGDHQKKIFANNLHEYEQRERSLEKEYDKIVEQYGSQYLTSILTQRRMSLLRYPLLCNSAEQRDSSLAAFNAQGLGASPLYQRAIVEIPLVLDLVEVQGDLKNAKLFARRFLTLPLHQQVSSRHLARIKKVLG